MDPRQLFPWLAVAFALAAAWRYFGLRRADPGTRTWLLLAAIFALVSAWLDWKS